MHANGAPMNINDSDPLYSLMFNDYMNRYIVTTSRPSSPYGSYSWYSIWIWDTLYARRANIIQAIMNTIFLQWQKKINITKWTCKNLNSCVKAAMTICSVYKARYWLNFCYDIYLWNIKILDSPFGNYKLVYWSVENYTYWKLFAEKTTIESMTLCLKNLSSINTYRIFSFIRAHFVLDLSWCLLITHGSQLHSRLFLSFSSGKRKQSVSAILSKGK